MSCSGNHSTGFIHQGLALRIFHTFLLDFLEVFAFEDAGSLIKDEHPLPVATVSLCKPDVVDTSLDNLDENGLLSINVPTVTLSAEPHLFQ